MGRIKKKHYHLCYLIIIKNLVHIIRVYAARAQICRYPRVMDADIYVITARKCIYIYIVMRANQ